MNPPSNFAPIKAASHEVGVCDRTIRRMISRGDLHGYRFGPRLLFVNMDEVMQAFTVVPTIGTMDQSTPATFELTA